MTRLGFVWTLGLLGAGMLAAQGAAKVDFAKDVLPLLRQNCFGCHGPAMQQGGLRLDRRSSVMKVGSRRLSPGSAENSFLYHRISGTEYGPQMPPTGALKAEQIAVVKKWIEQGAVWPDSLANEQDLPPLDPKAIAMVESLRSDDMASFLKAASADPKLLNARGPEGSTPFMYAALYKDAATLEKLIKMGADPNKKNDAKATALMWAARDLEKTRVLVEHGADVNAKSDDLRTPLMIAARRIGAGPIVKLLLDHKANPNPNTTPETESSPLIEALTGGDAAVVEMLLAHGADAKAGGDMGMTMAITSGCAKCLVMIVGKITDKAMYTAALQSSASLGDLRSIRILVDHGADVNAFDPLGRTPLMYLAVSDVIPVEAMKLLIERGADVNARDRHKNSGDGGMTVLQIAKSTGDPRMIQLLLKAGAKEIPEKAAALKPRQNNSIRSAVEASLPLLQHSDVSFLSKSGCYSCHDNSMTAMTVSLARSRGLRVDEKTAAAQVRGNAQMLEKSREILHQGFGVAVGDVFGDFANGYVGLGLHDENYKPDLNTDALALYILSRQSPNGDWPYPRADNRPPICLSYVSQTAIALRVLQEYAPKPVQAQADKAIRMAAAWLANAKSANNEDRAWRLTGLVWAGADRAATQKASRELVETQHPDGGWSELATMKSTAYSTGLSLVALQRGGMAVTDPVYQRGIRFLLATQQEDGSWYVKTRALGFQPWFDAGFPHAYDQWISDAGTGWAAMALTLALPEAGALTAARE